jgi:hypothetical protein
LCRYQKPGAKKNKYQKPGAKKNKYQRTDVAEGGEDGGYSFDDPHANHMAQGIKVRINLRASSTRTF